MLLLLLLLLLTFNHYYYLFALSPKILIIICFPSKIIEINKQKLLVMLNIFY